MCLGIPGQIVEVADADANLATADVSGVRRRVNVACVLGGDGIEALIGKWVLIHVGFAMAVIDEEEARKTMETLTELGEAQDELEAMLAGDRAVAGRT